MTAFQHILPTLAVLAQGWFSVLRIQVTNSDSLLKFSLLSPDQTFNGSPGRPLWQLPHDLPRACATISRPTSPPTFQPLPLMWVPHSPSAESRMAPSTSPKASWLQATLHLVSSLKAVLLPSLQPVDPGHVLPPTWCQLGLHGFRTLSTPTPVHICGAFFVQACLLHL